MCAPSDVGRLVEAVRRQVHPVQMRRHHHLLQISSGTCSDHVLVILQR